MNRRTLLFILCVSLSFFVVEIYFANKHRESNRQWYEQQEALKQKRMEELRASVEERTARPADLPLLSLYRDANQSEVVGRALEAGEALLVLLPDAAPEQLFAHGREGPFLRLNDEGPVYVYGRDGSKLPVVVPNALGKYDLQLVTYDKQGGGAEISLAEYEDGVFVSLLDDPSDSALAAILFEGKFLPGGFYDGKSGEFFLLDELVAIADVVEVQLPQEVRQAATHEQFFVLENEYAQLVFSNRGGSLVEINLPLEGEENHVSVVKPIPLDRKVDEQSPANSFFPLRPYLVPGSQPNGPFVEKEPTQRGGYYPLLRRPIIDRGLVAPSEAQHHALTVVSQYPEVAELRYEVKAFDRDRIVFETTQRHRRITKTFKLRQGAEALPYLLELEVKVDGDSRGLWLTSGLPEVELVSGRSSPAVKVRQTRGDRGEVENVRLPKDALTVSSFNPDWVCNSNGFLGVIIDPVTTVDAGYMVQNVGGVDAPSRLTLIDRSARRYKAADYPAYNTLIPLSARGGTMQFRVYAGPFEGAILKEVDSLLTDPATGASPDYVSCQTYHGWFSFISEPIAKLLFFLMKGFYNLTGSWGLSIILLTVAVRALLFPLNAWSMRSIRKTQKLSPLVQKIQKKYKKDPKRMQMEIMNLYREHKANPLGGCLPMLIQLPFLIGMFDLLRSAFSLRGASFIPGWIDDLASPDVLFRWNASLPFIGNELHLLPLLVGGIMVVQSKLMSAKPADPNNLTDMERQQRMMTTIMPVAMTFLFYNFASGLNLYMLSSTILGIAQQWYTNRSVDSEQGGKEVSPSTPKGKSIGRVRSGG